MICFFQYQKIGSKVLTPYNTDEEVDFERKRSRDCCTCGETSEMEPQTPSPLLENEELDSLSPDKDLKTTTQLFLNTHFKARRHFSTPITPTFRPDGVV
jgi:hypothetical protein